jgi:hypothetical protein
MLRCCLFGTFGRCFKGRKRGNLGEGALGVASPSHWRRKGGAVGHKPGANLDRTGAWYGGSEVQESSSIFVRDFFGRFPCGWRLSGPPVSLKKQRPPVFFSTQEAYRAAEVNNVNIFQATRLISLRWICN